MIRIVYEDCIKNRKLNKEYERIFSTDADRIDMRDFTLVATHNYLLKKSRKLTVSGYKPFSWKETRELMDRLGLDLDSPW